MPFKQNDIVKAKLGQVVGHTRPSNTTSTDDDFGMSREIQTRGTDSVARIDCYWFWRGGGYMVYSPEVIADPSQ